MKKPSFLWLTGKKGCLSASLLLALAVSIALFSIPMVQTLEWRLTDFWARETHGGKISDKVAVIGIDEKFYSKYAWPLKKQIYAELGAYLSEMGAKAIVFDLLFINDLNGDDHGDSLFLLADSLIGNTVLGYAAYCKDNAALQKAAATPIPERYAIGKGKIQSLSVYATELPYSRLLQKSPHCGFINVSQPSFDNINRKMPLFISQDSLIFPSLALNAVTLLEQPQNFEWRRDRQLVVAGPRTIPVDSDGQIYVDFKDSIPYFAMSDIITSERVWASGEKPAIGYKDFDGRIVFIGNTALSLNDFGATPLSRPRRTEMDANVFMHAYAACSLVSGSALHYLGRKSALCASLSLLLLSLCLFMLLRLRFAIMLNIGMLVISFFAAGFIYYFGVMVPILEGLSASLLMMFFYLIVNKMVKLLSTIDHLKKILVPSSIAPPPAPCAGDGPYFFISYKREEMPLIVNHLHYIKGCGFNIWYDKGITGGADFQQTIEDRIINCQKFLLFISRKSLSSRYVKGEIYVARRYDKSIVPITLELKVKFPRGMLWLEQLQLLDATSETFREQLENSLKQEAL